MTTLHLALPLLLLILAIPRTHAADPKSPALSRDAFSALFLTEADRLDAATWDAAVDFEWDTALAGQAETGLAYPYLLCNSDPSISGYRRVLALQESANTTNFRTGYNSDEITCAIASVLPSDAVGMEGEFFQIQPWLPAMKLAHTSWQTIDDEIEAANSGNATYYLPSVDVIMCPQNTEPENDTDAGEWTEDLTESLLEKIGGNISENFYITSAAYLESGLAEEEVAEVSSRLKQILDTYQFTAECNDVFSTRVTYQFAQATSASRDLSTVLVEFNTTGITDQDTGCIVTLVLGFAVLPTVCSIEPRAQTNIRNVEAQWITQSYKEDERPFFDTGLRGEGQVVAISDTGIDQNNCYFWDSTTQASLLFNPDARKVAQYIPYVNDDDYIYGHGTHVAGTVAGKRAVKGDIESNGAADGLAPHARIAFLDIGGPLGGMRIPSFDRVMSTGRPHAKIHTASWGSDFNSYTLETRAFDQYMFDEDDFLLLVAAGNTGDNNRLNTVGTPATGKNMLSVGSHNNGGNSAPRNSPGVDYVSGFSSRGPTKDGRMKPDLLAPGNYVLSAGARPGEVGECDPEDGSLPRLGLKKEGLNYMAGTSMSSPAAAGVAALVRQYFTDGYYPSGTMTESDKMENPSGALIKAVLMNGAQQVRGVDNALLGITSSKLYDENQGYGRVSLADSLFLPGSTNVQLNVFDREVVMDGNKKTYTLNIVKSEECNNQNLSVTLVWMDPASLPFCQSCLLNDLDLSLARGGDEFHPNGRRNADRLNNAERVIVGASDGDEFTISVKAHNLIGPKQKYALVATGCFKGTEEIRREPTGSSSNGGSTANGDVPLTPGDSSPTPSEGRGYPSPEQGGNASSAITCRFGLLLATSLFLWFVIFP